MRVVGLTGSIAMGKTATAAMAKKMGLPVYDADAIVHRLYRKGGAAVAPIGATFPGTVIDGAIDRTLLGREVVDRPASMDRLLAIVYPLVWAEERRFLALHRRNRRSVALLDIPMLLETRGGARCDTVLVVTATRFLQRRRALARAGMTNARLSAILQKQMPDHRKRRWADGLVRSGLGRGQAWRDLRCGLRKLGKGKKRQCGRSSWIRRPRG